jgi:putative zinc finger protein
MPLHLAIAGADMADSAPGHPADETVAAYLESTLSASDRALLESHLGDCEYCRARLVLAGRALETAPRPLSEARRRRSMLVGLAAAASLAGILLLSRSAAVPTSQPSDLRATDQEVSLPALRVIGPLRGDTVDAEALRFRWSGMGSDALYQVTLSASDGRMLWTERTADTIAAPPAEILRQLQTGQPYFWRVDALLSTLRSVTSGDQPFQVSP